MIYVYNVYYTYNIWMATYEYDDFDLAHFITHMRQDNILMIYLQHI